MSAVVQLHRASESLTLNQAHLGLAGPLLACLLLLQGLAHLEHAGVARHVRQLMLVGHHLHSSRQPLLPVGRQVLQEINGMAEWGGVGKGERVAGIDTPRSAGVQECSIAPL